MRIPYADTILAGETIYLPIHGGSGGMILILLAVNYWNAKGTISKDGYSPLEIIEVIEPE